MTRLYNVEYWDHEAGKWEVNEQPMLLCEAQTVAEQLRYDYDSVNVFPVED